MVLQPYTQYNPRQQSFPTSHMQYAPPLPYYQYQYVPTLQQQPPPHSRSAVTVNTNVNVANTLQTVQSVQNGPLSGPGPTSSQLQLLTSSVQAGANTVIGVGGPGNGMGQVGVAPMVGVIPTAVPSQAVPVQPSRRRHQHRLQIIDPATKKNILDDLDKVSIFIHTQISFAFDQILLFILKTTTTTENPDSSEQTITTSVTAVALDSKIGIPTQDTFGANVECTVALQSLDSRITSPYIPLGKF